MARLSRAVCLTGRRFLGLADALYKNTDCTHRDVSPIHVETCGFGIVKNLEQFIAGNDTLFN